VKCPIMLKVAVDKKEKYDPTRSAIQTGVGAKIMDESMPRILGKKKLYHGTSRKAWKNIKKKGLMPEFGGSSSGSSSILGNSEYVRKSTGKVHAGPFVTARAHSNLSSMSKGKPMGKKMQNYMFGFLGIPTTTKGKVIPVYDDYHKFNNKFVPTMVKNHINGKHVSHYEVISNTSKAKKWKIDPDLPIAFRTKSKIGPEHFTRKYLFKNIKSLPKYIKKHPGRFSLGLGMLGGGTYLAYNGVKGMIPPGKTRNKT